MTVWVNGSVIKPESTSGFGWYQPYGDEWEFHYGDDEIGFDWNCAPEAGVVVYAAWNGAAGWDIRIRSDQDGTIFRFIHNVSLNGAFVGMRVYEGQRVALQGNSSTEDIARHSHFEVWPFGNISNRVDPVPWMRARVGASLASSSITPIINESEQDMRFVYSIKPNTDPENPAPSNIIQKYLYTENGLMAISDAEEEVLFRAAGKPKNKTWTAFYASELATLDANLRANAHRVV